LVLLLARNAGERGTASAISYYPSLLSEPGVLLLALECMDHAERAFVDWRRAAVFPIYRAAVAYAQAAHTIAAATGCCDADQAWVGGLLAPLGWFAAAIQPDAAAAVLKGLATDAVPARAQERLWGLSAQAIARRLATAWRLPPWLSATTGGLDLPIDVARHLGAEPDHFLAVQLAVHLVDEAGIGLHLTIGTSAADLRRELDVSVAATDAWLAEIKSQTETLAPPAEWNSPTSLALLPDLLKLAAAQRRVEHRSGQARLHSDVDALHEAVARQRTEGEERLHQRKLVALAELAAGAGHEINNPLAVISGQAQYLLLSEQEPARKKALNTIVNQTHRIHDTLKELMQFARPAGPRKQPVDLAGLLAEVVGGLQILADDRQVRVTRDELAAGISLVVDPGQMRTTLTALLRNGIEAAPAGGWASIRYHKDSAGISFVVEDNGPGPTPADREHLFDPFYSGRKAGRGRGLGLSTAWQLARQHGGDVAFAGIPGEPTRFVLTLPDDALAEDHTPERNGTLDAQPVARSA
jgi:signal transduction histidine kinase